MNIGAFLFQTWWTFSLIGIGLLIYLLSDLLTKIKSSLWWDLHELIELKGMTFIHDFGYSFPLFSSHLKNEGREIKNWVAKILIKSHAFLLDRSIWMKRLKIWLPHPDYLRPILSRYNSSLWKWNGILLPGITSYQEPKLF